MPGSDSISRTRAGCWSCRQKRVKCDENRPACRRCAKNGLQCNYGIRLVWREESIAKGVCHGRAGVWSKRGGTGTGTGIAADERPWQQQHQGKKRPRLLLRSPRGGGDEPVVSQSNRNIRDGVRRAPSASVFLNTTVDDLRLYFDYAGHPHDDECDDEAETLVGEPSYLQNRLRSSNTQNGVLARLSPALGYGPTAVGSVFSYDHALLSHYEAVICSSATLQDDVRSNPYRHLILPMAMQCEGLYHAVLAISANILSIADSKYGVAALEHRQRALRTLIAVLNRGCWTDRQVDEALGLVLILCWFEITDGCSSSWITHLDGLWRLLRQRRESRTRMPAHSEHLSLFLHRYFAFHLVLARTAFHVEGDVHLSNLETAIAISSASLAPTQDATDATRNIASNHTAAVAQDRPAALSKSADLLLLSMPGESPHLIDPYMGLSNALLFLINNVADLAWQNDDSSSGGNDDDEAKATELQSKVLRLKAELENLKQVSPSSTDTTTSSVELPGSEVPFIAEANRLGALLLLYEICSPTSPSVVTPRGGANRLLPHLPAEERRRYVREILDVIVRSPVDVMRTASSPLWPLFLAGCCATDDEERVLVLRIFEKAESRKRFGNIAPAREVVEMVWRQRDLAAQDERKRPRPGRSNAKSNSHAGTSGKTHPTRASHKRSRRGALTTFEWERAMAMMGGWKLSLT